MGERVLITGCPRSGTGYTSEVLRQTGLPLGHEVELGRGQVSWKEAPNAKQYGIVFHQVRDPIKVISSLTMPAMWVDTALPALKGLFDVEKPFRPYRFGDKVTVHRRAERVRNRLHNAMLFYYHWNRLVEGAAKYRFRVEDFDVAVFSVLEIAGVKCEPDRVNGILKATKRDSNGRPHDQFTWKDMAEVSPKVVLKVKEMAEAYGYSTGE